MRLHVSSVEYALLVHIIRLVQTSEVDCISGLGNAMKAMQAYI